MNRMIHAPYSDENDLEQHYNINITLYYNINVTLYYNSSIRL